MREERFQGRNSEPDLNRPSDSSRRTAASGAIALGVAAMLLSVGSLADAQTLARPGWAGSGLTVAQWWRNAVVFEVNPSRQPGSVPALTTLLTRMDDLQTLGADAILLRGVSGGNSSPGHSSEMAISQSFGSMDQIDQMMQEASRRRIRVLVEVPATLSGDALASTSRFWLSRGVSGIYLGSANGVDAPAQRQTIRAVLRGYVGQRVLAVGAGDAGSGSATGGDMELVTLHGFSSSPIDVAKVRQEIEAARRGAQGVSVAEIDPSAPLVEGAAAKARVATLMMVAGGVALRLEDTGAGPEAQAKVYQDEQDAKDARAIAAATSPAGVSNAKRAIAARKAAQPPLFAGDPVFQWTQRMIGLHRGDPAMLLGQQSLPDFDQSGAMVSVWRGRSGQVQAEIVNLRDTPVEVQLTEEFAGMHLRGSFLRPLARTDAGLGAMPLRSVKLPPFGVFLGELGR